MGIKESQALVSFFFSLFQAWQKTWKRVISPSSTSLDVVDTSRLSTYAGVFPTLKLGEGDLEQSAGNYIVYSHEHRDYLFEDMAGTCNTLIELLTLNSVKFL